MKLQYRITILIFVILLIVGVAGGALILHFQRQSAISQFEDSAIIVAEALYDSLVGDMLAARREHIQDSVARVAARPQINEAIIVSKEQRVYASGDISEIGQIRDDDEIAEAMASAEIMSRTEKQYGRNEVCVIVPIINQPECYTCHGADTRVLGAIEIGLDRDPLDAQIWNQTLIMGLIAGVTFVTVGAALTLMFRSAVVGPLSKLAVSARRVAQGDFSARAEVKGNDEVGMLAHTFNDMAERVQQYADELEESKRELEQRVKERTTQLQQMATDRGQLLERLISAQEEERRRIARELHDEAGQALTMIMMDLARAIDTLPDNAAEAKDKLSESRSLTAQTLAELRKLINDLRPEVLDQLGLVPALRSYTKSRLEAENIKARLSFRELDERLSPQIETTLFRVIQEAIANVVRHSGASKVNIEVIGTESEVTVTVEDDGRGFDVEATFEAMESWGLRGIRERVAIVGGELKIESGAGQGTRIWLRIPLESA